MEAFVLFVFENKKNCCFISVDYYYGEKEKKEKTYMMDRRFRVRRKGKLEGWGKLDRKMRCSTIEKLGGGRRMWWCPPPSTASPIKPILCLTEMNLNWIFIEKRKGKNESLNAYVSLDFASHVQEEGRRRLEMIQFQPSPIEEQRKIYWFQSCFVSKRQRGTEKAVGLSVHCQLLRFPNLLWQFFFLFSYISLLYLIIYFSAKSTDFITETRGITPREGRTQEY